jgi:hypothetical protein
LFFQLQGSLAVCFCGVCPLADINAFGSASYPAAFPDSAARASAAGPVAATPLR